MKYPRNIRIFIVIAFLQGTVFYAPVATLYRELAGIPLPTMLSIESTYWLIIILMEIPWGIFTAKYGYTRTLRLSFGMLLISKIVFALAGSYPAFLGERILLAVAYAGLSGCDGAYLYEARGDVPADKVYLVVGRATVSGLLIASPLGSLAATYSMRLTAWLTVGSHCLLFLVVFFLTEPQKSFKRAECSASHDGVPALRRVLRFMPGINTIFLLAATALVSVAAHTAGVFLNQLQYRQIGIDTGLFGVIHASLQVFSIAGMWLLSRSRKLSPRSTALLSAFSCAAMIFFFRDTTSAIASIFITACATLTANLFPAMSMTLQNEGVKSEGRSISLSVNGVIIEGFSMAAQFILSLAATAMVKDNYSAIALMLMVGGVLMGFYRRQRDRQGRRHGNPGA